ncbi:MAG: hypothetical protein V1884_00175 [Candidatus Omnitrophota bacterium]
MHKYLKAVAVILFLILGVVSFAFCEEESYTITTYYPSPYGVYNELTTYSNTNLAIQSGKVGIGTTSPSVKLHVYGDGAAGLAVGTSAVGGVQLWPDSSSYGPALIFPSSNALRFGTQTGWGAAGWRELMRISSGGNVGIGIASPSKKLEVAGEIKLSGATPSYKITNVAAPTADNDVANKAYVDAAGGTPSGAIVMFATACPTGWTRFLALDNMFPMGGANYGATGGADTHTHTMSLTGTLCASGVGTVNCPNSGITNPSGGGVARIAAPQIASTKSNIPPYVVVVWCKKN